MRGSSFPDVVDVTTARQHMKDLLDLAVHEHRPVQIERGGRERVVVLGADEVEELLAGYEFHPEVLFETQGVSIWLPELEVYGTGADFEEARDDLVTEVEDYVRDYLADLRRYRSAPNRAGHYPYVLRTFVAERAGRLAELLFAEPSAAA